MLGEDEALLEDIASDMDPEDGCLSVMDLDDEVSTTAFTPFTSRTSKSFSPTSSRTKPRSSTRSNRPQSPPRCLADGYVFVDETWTKTNMAPLRGWAQRGARLPGKAPSGHWNTMTFVAALRCDRLEAPWLLDGPVNGEAFRTYVEKVLAPTLRPKDLVIMDNLSSHKGPAIRRAIRDAGGRLILLPKYSPTSTPSEQVFTKLKHMLRKAAARTRETVCATIAEVLGTYTPEECANYLRNSAYTRT